MKKLWIFLMMGLLILSGCASESEKNMELADEYFQQGKYDHAAYNYVRVLETDRENETAYLRLIDSYMELGKLDDALKYLQTAETMFGAEKLADRRTNLERLIAASAPVGQDKPEATKAPTEVPLPTETPMPEITETPLPEATKAPTPTPVPTKAPTPTVAPKTKYTFKEVSGVMYTTSDLNVRTLPSVDGEKVGVLKKNAKVEVVRQCKETGWYELVYEGKLAYVSGKYLSAEKSVTPVPTATSTPKPTATPKPVVTAIPTAIPSPAATPAPTVAATPTPQPEFVLQIPNLPEEYIYYFAEGEKMSSIRISEISHNYEYGESGLGDLILYFSGEITYDYAANKNLCGVMWVLIDENGEIVANDILYVVNLGEGTSFTNATCSVPDLLSGSYQLELYNIGTGN